MNSVTWHLSLLCRFLNYNTLGSGQQFSHVECHLPLVCGMCDRVSLELFFWGDEWEMGVVIWLTLFFLQDTKVYRSEAFPLAPGESLVSASGILPTPTLASLTPNR